MYSYPSFILQRGVVAVALIVSAGVFAPNGQAQPPPPADEIRAACPDKPRVAPQKPRKVLVFSLPKGFVHPSIGHGEKALQILGEKTGAFTVVATRDPEYFRPDKLREFDAVIMNNASGELFSDPELRESFHNFVLEGKGLVGIHGATTAFREWPQYGDMIGAYFNTHPWNAASTVTIKVEDPEHALTAAFPEPTLTLVEELYQFKENPYSRTRLRVLLSLDTARTDMTKPGIDRFDNDFPVSWVRTHGKGRVFYSSLGHNFHIFSNPVILQHFLDGIQFALGDLPAETDPRPEVAQEILTAALPERLEGVRGHTFGENGTPLTYLNYLVREAKHYPTVREHFAREIGGLLRETMAEPETSVTITRGQYLCRKLGELGTPEAVAALTPLLKHRDERMAIAARVALEVIRDEASAAALRQALDSPETTDRAGVAQSLGQIRDTKAIGVLAKAAGDEQTTVAEAAISSLGLIGTQEAAAVLADIAKSVPATLSQPVAAARVRCASLQASAGDEQDARKTFMEIMEEPGTLPQRSAALLGLAALGGAESRTIVVRTLTGDDPQLQTAAAAFLVQDRDAETGSEIVKALTGSTPEKQIAGLRVLVARQEAGALDFVREKATDKNGDVRQAALETLAAVGDASVVELLATSAASGSGQERQAARTSLAELRSEKADSAILELLARERELQSGEGARLREELVTALQARHAVEGVSELLKAAADTDAKVRAKAFQALTVLAGGDHAGQLVALLSEATPAAVRREAEKAVVAASRRISDESAREDAVTDALAKTSDNALIATYIRVLGRIGTPNALETLRSKRAAGVTDKQVGDALARSIAEFPTADAFPDALSLARDADSKVHQTLAVRGAARMLALPSDRTSTESVLLWSQLMELARQPAERKMILGEAGETAEPALLSFVLARLDDSDLKNEAVAAAIQIAEQAVKSAPDACREAMLQVRKVTRGEERKKANAVLKMIEKEKKP